jgi:hypothetical protein
MMQRLDQLCPAYDLGEVERQIRLMDSASNQWTAYVCWKSVSCQSEAQFPILATTQTCIEWAGALPCPPAYDDIRAPARDCVVSEERRHEFLWRQRSLGTDDVAAQVDDDRAGVDPIPTRLVGGLQLAHKFFGSPEVVVIEEREPIAARLGSCAIASGGHSARRVVADDANAGVGESGQHLRCVVGRRVVDDDHLEVDVALT